MSSILFEKSKIKIVVLGIGNILRQDEGIGVHMVNKILNLKSQILNLEIIDGGTSGVDLMPLIENVDKLIVIDAVKCGEKPGTIYRWEIEDYKLQITNYKLSLHQLDLLDTLNLLKMLGRLPKDIVIIGVEPEKLDWGCELSESVSEQKEKILNAVLKEIN